MKKQKILLNRLFILAALTLFAVPLSAQKADEDEAALRGLWGQFERVFNQYDAKGVASLYAPDGDRIDANFELARGRAEIANQYEKEFARRKADASTVPFHAMIAIRLLGADVAILDGESEGFRTGKRVRVQFTVIAKKGTGSWQIAAGRVRGLKEL
jgi:uncharacterized protein (TIGR02246 family)